MEKKREELPKTVRIIFFGCSGVSVSCLLHPLEVVKVRLQTAGGAYQGALHCARSVVAAEGVSALYAGVSAALLRHFAHTAAWVTAHSVLVNTLTASRPGSAAQRLLADGSSLARATGFHLPLYQRQSWLDKDVAATGGVFRGFIYGVVAGACAAVISTPAEVAMVRMASDGLLPPDRRRNYRNVADALRRLRREEGVTALWSGVTPTVARTVLSLGVSVPVYSQLRQHFTQQGMAGDSAQLHFYCSVCAGFSSSIVIMPVDFAKTRLQCGTKSCTASATLSMLRRLSPWQAVREVYQGLLPYSAKLLMTTSLAAICFDRMSAAYRWLHRPPSEDA